MADSEVDISIVRGNPTDEEIAALVTVLTVAGRRSEPEPAARPSGWSAYWRTVRAPISPGPHAWRMSARPQ